MGFLRLLFAICVVASHSQPIFGMIMLGGDKAVEIFFMISGFYMALILNEKYTGKGSYRTFISNRFLKIFPTYYICLLLTIVVSLVFYYSMGNALKLDPFFYYFDKLGMDAKAFVSASNLFIFGQDVVMFTGVDIKNGDFFFTSDFRKSNPPLYNFLLLPQAWSISVELMFYLIAPLIVRRNACFISAIIIASFAIKFYTINVIGLDRDPWTYRFFFSEISFFLLGALAYKLLPALSELSKSCKPIPIIAVAASTIFIVGYHEITGEYKYFILCSLLFITIPLAFSITKTSRIDRYIGELSFPVYLIHYLVNMSTGVLLKGSGLLNYKSEIVTVISIAISILIMNFLIKPIDSFRQQRAINLAESH